jgi:hypothetical protein
VGKVTCLPGAMDGELMKNLRECECDDREISSVRRHLNGMPQKRMPPISSCFASAETLIPTGEQGFS